MTTDEEVLSENLVSWNITSISGTGLEAQLSFNQPINVSQGYEYDMLLIFLNFSEFKGRDGTPIADFQYLKKKIPR